MNYKLNNFSANEVVVAQFNRVLEPFSTLGNIHKCLKEQVSKIFVLFQNFSVLKAF